MREYLDTLDDAAFGAASPVKPKFTSHSDPASQWTGARGGPAYFAYSANYLIDTDNGVILDVEATRSIRQAEVGSVHTMVDRVADTFDLKPERLIADTAYGTGKMLDWLVEERGIAPHIPVVHCPAGDAQHRQEGTSRVARTAPLSGPTSLMTPRTMPTPVRVAKSSSSPAGPSPHPGRPNQIRMAFFATEPAKPIAMPAL